jgi:Na+-translocating ferredoxin:NAD+ oxidoreductase RnfC subunit
MATDIITAVEQAGVVGAGGAGFPTHIKLQAKAEIVIANGCECEPLLCSDRHLMHNEPQAVVQGLSLAMRATGAKTGVIALKAKYTEVIQAISDCLPADGRINIHELKDYYPIGDEQLLVYEVTGKLVPPGGIPPQVGVVVCNVATLYNIVQAQQGIPVTHRYVTVAGEVAYPKTLCVPIGSSLGELIELAGGSLADEPALILGGPMMGRLVYDLSLPVTKSTGAVLVFDREHSLVLKKRFWAKSSQRQASSLCHQCGGCTQICPRSLLGHDISPHRTMSRAGYAQVQLLQADPGARLCSECGLCASYACCMGLSPAEAHRRAKSKAKTPPVAVVGPHPLRDYRYVPTGRLTSRLGLRAYNVPIPYDSQTYTPSLVKLPLKQHAGAPAVPLVKKGEQVHAGQLVAETPANILGAKLHSPIAGRVLETEPEVVVRH